MILAHNLKSIAIVGSVCLASVLGAGCKGGGGGYSGGGGGYVDPYANAFFDVFGRVCGFTSPAPGCNFRRDGRKIKDIEDPGFFYSYNLEYGLWLYTDSYGFDSTYLGLAWLSSATGILFDDRGYALNETQRKGVTGNTLNDVFGQRQKVVQAAAKDLQKKHGLKSDGAYRLASSLMSWSEDRRRGITNQNWKNDQARFKAVYGVEWGGVENALTSLENGDSSAAEAQLQNVAIHWGAKDASTAAQMVKGYFRVQ